MIYRRVALAVRVVRRSGRLPNNVRRLVGRGSRGWRCKYVGRDTEWRAGTARQHSAHARDVHRVLPGRHVLHARHLPVPLQGSAVNTIGHLCHLAVELQDDVEGHKGSDTQRVGVDGKEPLVKVLVEMLQHRYAILGAPSVFPRTPETAAAVQVILLVGARANVDGVEIILVLWDDVAGLDTGADEASSAPGLSLTRHCALVGRRQAFRPKLPHCLLYINIDVVRQWRNDCIGVLISRYTVRRIFVGRTRFRCRTFFWRARAGRFLAAKGHDPESMVCRNFDAG